MASINYLVQKIKNNPFPSVVVALFILLTLLGISGSSMGSYDQIFLGKPTGTLLGVPRPIRSDEWLVATQETLAQKAANYPAINKDIGAGQDMSMIIDVPYKGFFSIFKPENLFFLIMPYSNAFAAHWWFMSLVLVLGFYYLMDALFPNKRLIISLSATLLLFNPFVQWWYLSAALLSIGYALWACLMFVKIFENKITNRKLVLSGLGLSYFALCFAYVLYPPFQLSIAYVIIALLAGFLYYRYSAQRVKLLEDVKRWVTIFASVLLVIAMVSIFFIEHKQVINTIVNTAYPGARSIQSGQNGVQVNLEDTFSAPILFNLQRSSRAIFFYTNQSEASRIVAINLLLIPFFVFYVLKKPLKNRKLADYLLLSTSAIAGIFMLRMFTPFFNLPFKLLLFDKVQNERLAIGLVLLCAIQLVLFGVLEIEKISIKKAGAIAIIVFAVFYDASLIMVHQYPKFISGKGALLACLIIGLVSFLILQKKYFVAGLAIFTLFSVASSIFINPIYDRSEPVALKSAASFIKKHYSNNKSWVVFDTVVIENIPAIAGEHSLSGVQVYPQLSLWEKIDSSQVSKFAYNRYAHVIFNPSLNPNDSEFYNPQGDVLVVHFDCSIAAKLPDFGYALSPDPVSNPATLQCLKLSNTIIYPKITLFIYRYNAS